MIDCGITNRIQQETTCLVVDYSGCDLHTTEFYLNRPNILILCGMAAQHEAASKVIFRRGCYLLEAKIDASTRTELALIHNRKAD